MTHPRLLDGDGEHTVGGLKQPNSDRPYDAPKRGVDGQRLREAFTATAAKRGATRMCRNKEEAQKRALAQFAPPEVGGSPNSGAGRGDGGSDPGGDTPAGDDAPDMVGDRHEGAAAEGESTQQKPAQAKVQRIERADESGPGGRRHGRGCRA